ncbi:uncharacterized protein LOC62_02G003251 [Vanrija pseudolonga]|uniref:Uncharacterized protein n=1 Tax=Vanrija pseudolonga TaxID=143232 RepID=A0AAF0Y431_9TREE|nr:hypothetical protein LOC62_02G003251 [Vanrija pseudolonga]
MPTVITNSHSTRSYAPLADENSPVASPTVSINGTVVYSKRLTPPGSSSNSEDDHKNGSSLMDSDETLAGARRNKSRGHFAVEDDDSGSLKGKNRAWGERATDYVEDDAAYPPVNALEEEEKRVQANLAKFAARETARRKAARTSRFLPSHVDSPPPSASSSTSSLSATQRLSVIGESVRRTVVGGKAKGVPEGTELSSALSSSNAQTYTNPYDSQNQSPSDSPTSPTMHGSSPFADPPTANGHQAARTAGSSNRDGDFGYVGSEWRGGEAATNAPPRQERWWHSICSWGNDLDGGHDKSKQAGRTNPFE